MAQNITLYQQVDTAVYGTTRRGDDASHGRYAKPKGRGAPGTGTRKTLAQGA